MKDKIPANRSDGYMVMKDKIPANRSDGYMVMKNKIPGPGRARARPDLSPAQTGVSSDRKSKENLCEIQVLDQQPTFSTAFCNFFVWRSNFCRDVRNEMYVFAISSEICNTLRGVY